MKSVMNHDFSKIPAPQIQRSMFNRSHGHKTTFDEGDLIPIYLDEILPGDTVSLKCTALARIATLLYPIMDNLFFDMFFFFVPARLLWNHWEQFNGAQSDPGDSTDYVIPTLTGDPVVFANNSLGDYFGLPTLTNFTYLEINALPFRAYNLIWNDWFRDENLQDSVDVPLTDGPDNISLYPTPLKRGKRHDYFTSALPWPQKGESVELPLGTNAPVIGTGMSLGLDNGVAGTHLVGLYGSSSSSLNAASGNYGANIGVANSGTAVSSTAVMGVTQDPTKSGLIADLSAATAATINQLRQAFAYQSVLERDARGGTRYVEFLKAHFGVTSPDFRLQRPEFLGGYSQRMNVTQVAQTSSTDTASPQGNLAAYGHMTSQAGFHHSFVEHGYVIGLANVRGDITYQNGVNKMWLRSTRFDFYLPALAHLGEQAIVNGEIFVDNTTADADVFGYQERWAEYRYKPSFVTGAFRSNYPGGSLDAWHLALDFGSRPVLNSTFIQDQPPITRIIADTADPHFLLDTFFDIKHARPMPVYSIPSQLGRF